MLLPGWFLCREREIQIEAWFPYWDSISRLEAVSPHDQLLQLAGLPCWQELPSGPVRLDLPCVSRKSSSTRSTTTRHGHLFVTLRFTDFSFHPTFYAPESLALPRHL